MKRKVPPVTGQVTLDTYDLELWNCVTDFARELGIPLSLFVHDAVIRYHGTRARLVKWRQEQDDRDPDLHAIREFLDEYDPNHEHDPFKA